MPDRVPRIFFWYVDALGNFAPLYQRRRRDPGQGCRELALHSRKQQSQVSLTFRKYLESTKCAHLGWLLWRNEDGQGRQGLFSYGTIRRFCSTKRRIPDDSFHQILKVMNVDTFRQLCNNSHSASESTMISRSACLLTFETGTDLFGP